MLSRTAIGAFIVVSLAGAVAWFRPFAGGRGSSLDREFDRFAERTHGVRFTAGRLAGPFDWGPVRSPDRGIAHSTLPPDVLISALELQKRVAPLRTADGLHVAAVVHLALGETEQAIDGLESALELSPATAQLHSDLSAALFERARTRGSTLDLVRAFNEAEIALRASAGDPVARFNVAITLESLGAVSMSMRAWQDFLAVDATSAWASEARQHIADLPRQRTAKHTASRATSSEMASILAASAGWPAKRRGCLATAAADIDAWIIAFDDGDRGVAADRARHAAAAFRCAGAVTLIGQVALGWAALTTGDGDTAATIGRSAASSAAARNEWAALARSDELLGAIALEQSRFADSEDLRRTALVAARRAGDAVVAARLERLLGDTAEEQGDHEAAWRHYEAALQLLPDGASAFQHYDLLSSLTISAAHAGWAAAAAALAAPLVDAAAHVNRPGPQIFALMERSRARAALGDSLDALADLDHAKALAAGMPNPALRTAWEAELGWIQGLVQAETSPTDAIAGLTTAIEYFSGAQRRFRLAELLLHRARLYNRLNQPGSADADLQQGIAVLEDQRPAIRDEQLRISRAAEVWGLFAEAIRLRQGDARASLAMLERARARELVDHLSRAQRTTAMEVSSLQACLPDGAQALVYYVQPQQVLRWRVSASDVAIDTLPIARRELEKLVADSVTLFRANEPGAAAERLGRLLLPSLSSYDPSTQLILVPDGVLNRVPFAALPAADGRRLVESAVPLAAPSLSAFCLASSQPLAPVRDAMLVGVSQAVPQAGLPSLPEVTREIESLTAIYPRHQRLEGADATPRAVLDGMASHTIIHFAGHAQVDELAPSQSRLFLSNGALEPSDIAAVHLRPGTIVVLSACSTAIGREFSGEGALSLARPFLAAGATTVLASLWPIQDDPARRFIEKVHRRVAAGEALETALARAQRDAIADRQPSSSWSAYTVVGGGSFIHSSVGGGKT